MKICLRRSQTCCGGMYLCSDNTISFAKAKLHFRCLSPASIFLQTASSNNAAPAEKTDETEKKFFCLKYVSVSVFEHQQQCTSCFRARQANSAIQQRKFQFFGSKHFAEQFCAFTVSSVLAAQIRNIPEKTGNLRSSQSLHRIGSFSYLILELIWRPKPQRFMKSIRKYVFYKNAELAKQTNCAELCLLI